MNILWTSLLFFSFILIAIQNNFNILNLATTSIYQSLNTCLNLAIIYIFWCGILQILEDLGFNKKLSKILSYPLKIIFPKVKEKTKEQISLNLSANILGLGNASLPPGIKAMELLNNENNTHNLIDKNTALFICMNCLSIQIIPTTVLSLYSSHGGIHSEFIIIINIIVSFISIIFCLFFSNLLFKKKKVLN